MNISSLVAAPGDCVRHRDQQEVRHDHHDVHRAQHAHHDTRPLRTGTTDLSCLLVF